MGCKHMQQTEIMWKHKDVWLANAKGGNKQGTYCVTVDSIPSSVIHYDLYSRAQPRGRFGRKSLPKLVHFSLLWAEGEVSMYRTYREIQNLDQNFSLKS